MAKKVSTDRATSEMVNRAMGRKNIRFMNDLAARSCVAYSTLNSQYKNNTKWSSDVLRALNRTLDFTPEECKIILGG